MNHKRLAPVALLSSAILISEGSTWLKGNAPEIPAYQTDVQAAVEQIVPPIPTKLEEHPGLRLRETFLDEVGGIPLSPEQEQLYHADILRQLLQQNAVPDTDQYLLYVDRNPGVQIALIALVEAKTMRIITIGADKVSTGRRGRVGYFITPTGVFRHVPENLGYRAEGTKNKLGVRGLGKKGMRVWDLGDSEGETGWLKKPERRYMRLQIHATDPDLLEQKLGQPASKGCIRVSSRLNAFLDKYSLLDRQFETFMTNPNVAWLFRKDRITSPFEGEYVVIGESPSEIIPAQAAGAPGESSSSASGTDF